MFEADKFGGLGYVTTIKGVKLTVNDEDVVSRKTIRPILLPTLGNPPVVREKTAESSPYKTVRTGAMLLMILRMLIDWHVLA